MQKILTVILLVTCVGLCKCDDEPEAALDAVPPKPPCSCILPVVLLPGGGVLPGRLPGGILNNNNVNLTILKLLLANPSLLSVPGVINILNNLLDGGVLNAAATTEGPATLGLLNNALSGGILNSGNAPNPASGITGGALNNLLSGGVGNGVIPASLLSALLSNPKLLSDNSLLSSPSYNTAVASPGYATAYGF